MKNLSLILFSLFLLLVLSCSKADRCSELICLNDCEFVEIDRAAIVKYYGCYLTWGATYTNTSGDQIIGLAPDMIDDYKVEDMEIMFSATFHENDLPLSFPDPMPGRFYKIDICTMKSNSN